MKKIILLIFGAMLLSTQLMAQYAVLEGTIGSPGNQKPTINCFSPTDPAFFYGGNSPSLYNTGYGHDYFIMAPFSPCTIIVFSAPDCESEMYLWDTWEYYSWFNINLLKRDLEDCYSGRIPDMMVVNKNEKIIIGSLKDGSLSAHQRYQWQKKVGETWVNVSGAIGTICYIDSPHSFPLLMRRAVVNAGNGSYYGSSNVVHLVMREGLPRKNITKQIYTEANGANPMTAVSYLDGLGREFENVAVGASSSGLDIVSITMYDEMGRADNVSYLPYINSDPNGDPYTCQEKYYSQKFPGSESNYAYSQKIYDKSVEGLVLKQGGPGEVRSVAAGHPVEFDYRMNTEADQIKKYTVGPGSTLEYSGNYPVGMLNVRKTSTSGSDDNQNKEFYEYVDSEGRLIAKEVRVSAADRRFTYFVYDQLGRQRYMIPPIQDEKITATRVYTLDELKAYCFYTEYDKNGLVVKEYVPGAEPIFNIYDKRGRLVMLQTGNMRDETDSVNNKWNFIKYDDLNRPVMTGVYTGGTYESHLAALNAQAVFGEKRGAGIHGYTNLSYPQIESGNDVLTVSYFDDYDWVSGADFSSADALENSPSYDVLGLSTGSKTKVLGVDNHQWLTSVVYYDSKYNVVQTINDLYPLGREIVSNKHNFQGVVTQARVKQVVGNQTNEYLKTFAYDRMGRLLNIKQRITGDTENEEVTLVSYTYDDLGKVATKSINNGLDTERYDYNIAGATISASSPSFSYKLGFENAVVDGAPTRYDGNLSQIAWSDQQGRQRAYSYSYDKLGQMTAANFLEKSSGGWTPSAKYSENGLQYDKNGNILALKRSDDTGGVLHDMDYYYDGNAVVALDINGSQSAIYEYDRNGNMTFDGRTGIGIEYNILGLPQRIFAGAENITYIYSATGEKLASKVGSSGSSGVGGSMTYYRSVMVYNGDQLSQILHPEGFTACTQTGKYQYNYLKRDHLGSTRQVLAALKGSGGATTMEVMQETDYYAFGLAHSTNNLHVNKYLFSGKELQDASIAGELLGLYDFGARYYDPLVGRWFNIDPMAAKYPGISPYVYCANNPVMFIDPNGMEINFMEVAQSLGFQTFGAYETILDNIGAFQITAYYSDKKKTEFVGYGAFRNGRNQFWMSKKGDLKDFKNNLTSLTEYADLFYANGNPSAQLVDLFAWGNGSGRRPKMINDEESVWETFTAAAALGLGITEEMFPYGWIAFSKKKGFIPLNIARYAKMGGKCIGPYFHRL